MGGLATALALAKEGFTSIDVFEHASDLGFVGAGIHLAPNMARVLDRLGVWEEIKKEGVVADATSIRGLLAVTSLPWSITDAVAEGSSDGELANVNLNYVEPTYGYPHMIGHRSSLAGGLYNGCKKQPAIKFHFASPAVVNSFDEHPSLTVTPRDGSPEYTVHSDIILAADGIKSKTRVELLKILGVEASVQDTNQAAYRIMINRDQILDDPELLELMDGNRITRWIGEKRHIIAYPISNNTIYNMSTTQPDSNFAGATNATYTTRGSKSAMLGVFGDFCPKIHRLLNLVPDGEVCEWKLRVHEPIPTWIHKSVALVGDACHPTLPHMAQGAAQAIEDAAVVAVALSRLPDTRPGSINKALRVYETIRKTRAETLVELAALAGRSMHLGEGAEKEARDRQFEALRRTGKGPVPDRWADAEIQSMVYGTDCAQIARDTFDAHFRQM